MATCTRLTNSMPFIRYALSSVVFIKKKTFYVFAGWLGYSNQLVFLLGRTENLLGRIQKIKKAYSLAHVLEINHSQEL